mgnify:CR=1 FL=1
MSNYEKHEHNKVYSKLILTSYPPQYPWICSECGEEGIEQGMLPEYDYDDLKRKFKK